MPGLFAPGAPGGGRGDQLTDAAKSQEPVAGKGGCDLVTVLVGTEEERQQNTGLRPIEDARANQAALAQISVGPGLPA